MRTDTSFFKFALCQIRVAIFEVKVSYIPHSKSLLILKAGYMYSAVFYDVMHGIMLYTVS